MTALRHLYPAREAALDLALHGETIAEQSALDLAALTGAAGDEITRLRSEPWPVLPWDLRLRIVGDQA